MNRIKRMETQLQSPPDVEIERNGAVLVLRLARPRVLNALTMGMVETLLREVAAAERSDQIRAIVLEGSGTRAFCAGGDIRALANPPGGDVRFSCKFFYTEFVLDCLIHEMKTPVVALWRGLVMGGGVGLSIGATFRVATDSTLWAMPETAIGLFPDVGSSYVFSRLEGEIGMYLGLTGHRCNAADVMYAGLATHFVPESRWVAFREAVISSDVAESKQLETLISKWNDENAKNSSECFLRKNRQDIDECFSGNSLEEVFQRLEKKASSGNMFATETLKTLGKMSPLSLKITFRSIRGAKQFSLHEAFAAEYRIASRLTTSHSADFIEGVRALLIDKDKAPRWGQNVDSQTVDEIFSPLPPSERPEVDFKTAVAQYMSSPKS